MANYYHGDLTWADLTQAAAQISENIRNIIAKGEEEARQWQVFRAGRTNKQIATSLSVTESAIVDMNLCFLAGHKLYDYANNQTPSQKDYNADLRKFSR